MHNVEKAVKDEYIYMHNVGRVNGKKLQSRQRKSERKIKGE